MEIPGTGWDLGRDDVLPPNKGRWKLISADRKIRKIEWGDFI